MKEKIDRKQYKGVVTPDLKKQKFFLKWVNGWIKTVEDSRGVYYINPKAICSISDRILINKKHTQVSIGCNVLFLNIEKEKFFKFLTTKSVK